MARNSVIRKKNPVIFLGNLNEKHLTAIGQIITQWSILEILIDACIWRVAGLRNDYGRIISAQNQMRNKLDTLEALLFQRRPILGEQFKLVADYVRNCLMGERNIITHGWWYSDTNTGEFSVSKFSARGRLLSQGRQVSLDDLEQLALDIGSVSGWLLELAPLLPKQRLRPGGLGHKTRDNTHLQDCANRKTRALQLPTLSRKELEKRA